MLPQDVKAVIHSALEECFNIIVADDEIGAAAFQTLGSLTRFVESKLAG